MGRPSHRRGIVRLHSCDVCGGICEPKQTRHATCAVFHLFRERAKPQFYAVVSVLRRETAAPLLARYDECGSIDALSEFLEQIRGLNRILIREDSRARLESLILRVDRMRLISEYVSFTEFRTAIRPHFISAISNVRRRGLALHRFDRAQSPRELKLVLYSARSALTDPTKRADPDRITTIRFLLIENRMFETTHEEHEPDEDDPVSSVRLAPACATSA